MSATLSQMMDFVCFNLGVFDDFSKQLCAGYLVKEYNAIWDRYPWKDTQMGPIAIAIPAGQNTVDYPAGMDRIISIRAVNIAGPVTHGPSQLSGAGSYFLEPIDATFLMESEPDIFDQTGLVKYYEEAGAGTGTKQIVLYPTPQSDVTLYLLGKAVYPGFPGLGSTVGIRNIDNALMAYAAFDLLQRQRQYAKAKEKYAEAQQLEQVAVDLEQKQANLPRRTKTTTVAGNSLAEMTDAVCMICGQWTPDYRQMIREFIRRNYVAAYDLQLWPGSVVGIYVPYRTEQIVLPEYVDKVLGIRGRDNFRMSQQDPLLVLDLDPTSFEAFGHEMSYSILTPVGVSVLPGAPTYLFLASTAVQDVGKVFIRGETAGNEIWEEIKLDGTNRVRSAKMYEVPLTIAKDITVGDVTVNGAAFTPAPVPNQNFVIIPASKREMKHQRLWFLPRPDNDNLAANEYFTCLIFAKRKINPLQTDQDTPIITGMEATLIAAAAADLFRKLGQADQATAFQAKADASAKVLMDRNMNQQAHEPRFVPEIEPYSYSRYDSFQWVK